MRRFENILPEILKLLAIRPEEETKSNNLADLINQAREELNQAYNVFSNVSDPELVEIAVLNIEVAKKRFDYLIRELKSKTVK